MKKFAPLSLFLIYSLLIGFVPKAAACGPFTVEPVFSLKKHADYPLVEYAGGRAGIVPDSFGRMSLFVFYRLLDGLPLSQEEQKQVAAAMQNRIDVYQPDGDAENTAPPASVSPPNYYEKWKTARGKILAGELNIEPDKRVPDEYYFYSNCLPDAFHNATATLENRIEKYGIGDDTREWLAGQDVVFSNCDAAQKMPAPLTGNAPEWLRRDREYQIAAAIFYTGDNAAAREKFEQIAADSNSPWNKTARFVAARTYIRQASFIDDSGEETVEKVVSTNSNSANFPIANGSSEEIPGFSSPNANSERQSNQAKPLLAERKNEKRELLQKARTELQNILADVSMSDFHDSARRLAGLTAYRLNPRERQTVLAGTLLQPNENKNIYNDLIDYVWLLDPIENRAHETGEEIEQKQAEKEGKTYDYNLRFKLRDLPVSERQADLTDWLFTYQAEDGFAHAFEKWKETGKKHWLVAAIVKAESGDKNTPKILRDSVNIPQNSPAFATVRFHRIRLLLDGGNRTEAVKELGEIFARDIKEFPVSTQNKFFAQRAATAENLDEFLKYAQRRATSFVWSDDANEKGDDLENDKELSVWKTRSMFDEDAVAFLNEKMPLSTLRQAALSPQIPEHLKKVLIEAVWTRAFIIGNQPIEREFAPLMLRYAKEFTPEFSKYSTAATATERQAAALKMILSYPVIQPFVPVGFGRENSPPAEIDSTRGNWWCVVGSGYEDTTHYDQYKFQYPSVYPKFLTAAETETAGREQKILTATGNSATFLARRAVEFANQNPGNPQTPEILHLAVRSTRYGCTDDDTLKFSKQAFQILHRRYPNSVWTKKTPFWFG